MAQAGSEVVLDREGEAEAADLEDAEQDANAGEESDDADGSTGDEVDGEGSETDEVVVTIGEESPPSEDDEFRGKPAPKWLKDLRESNREKDRRIRELEEKAKTAAPPEKAAEVGSKPTLEACDFDAERFGTELEAWHQRKRDAEAQAEKKRKDADAATAAWQATLDSYNKAKAELKVKNVDDVEAVARDILSITQQGVILQGAENPALVVIALGMNPKKAKELAAIADPVKFAFAVAKLETQLKVTPRRAAPLPERSVRGSAPVSGTVDSTLERLRAEAQKTGDLTKVTAYKRQLRSRGK